MTPDAGGVALGAPGWSSTEAAATEPPGARPTTAVVVVAAGSASRMGADRNKVLLPLAGAPVLAWSLLALARTPGLARMVVVIRPQDRALVMNVVDDLPDLGVRVELVPGGSTRHDSEYEALRHLASAIRGDEIDVVLVHDGCRPLITTGLVAAVADAAWRRGGAIPAVTAEDLIRVSNAGTTVRGSVVTTPDLIRVQTPQGFRAAPLLAAYETARRDGFQGTDTSSCVERYTSLDVLAVPGEDWNLKITRPGDLFLAEQFLWHYNTDRKWG